MANIPQDVLQKENKLNHELARIKKEIYYEENADEPDNDYMDQLLSSQLEYRKTLDSLLVEIETQYPKYYQLKYSEKEISISELQNTILKNDETLVEYFLTEKEVYVFVISQSKISFKVLPKAKEVQSVLQNYRTHLNKRESIAQLSNKLYNLLLRDLNIKTKRLIIIPDKELNHLPFEALMNANKFLVEDYIICYSGSASLLQTQQDDFFRL